MIWNEFGVGMTSLNDDQPGEITVSSKSSMNASACVFMRTRVPALAQTPVAGAVVVVVPLVVPPVPVVPLLLLLGWVVLLLPPAPVPFGLAVPDEHADDSATAQPAV